jgi:hypothetical protein
VAQAFFSKRRKLGDFKRVYRAFGFLGFASLSVPLPLSRKAPRLKKRTILKKNKQKISGYVFVF